MKLLFFNLLFVLGAATILAQPAKTSYKTFSDKKKGISIKYPATWSEKIIEGAAFFLIRPTEEPGQKFAENINLIIDPPDDLSLEEYAASAREKLKTQMEHFHEIGSEYVKINGRDYFKLFYTFKYKNFSMHDVYYVTVYKNCSYNFTCSALEGTFTKFYPVFEKMIRSFTVK